MALHERDQAFYFIVQHHMCVPILSPRPSDEMRNLGQLQGSRRRVARHSTVWLRNRIIGDRGSMSMLYDDFAMLRNFTRAPPFEHFFGPTAPANLDPGFYWL